MLSKLRITFYSCRFKKNYVLNLYMYRNYLRFYCTFNSLRLSCFLSICPRNTQNAVLDNLILQNFLGDWRIPPAPSTSSRLLCSLTSSCSMTMHLLLWNPGYGPVCMVYKFFVMFTVLILDILTAICQCRMGSMPFSCKAWASSRRIGLSHVCLWI